MRKIFLTVVVTTAAIVILKKITQKKPDAKIINFKGKNMDDGTTEFAHARRI